MNSVYLESWSEPPLAPDTVQAIWYFMLTVKLEMSCYDCFLF